MPITNDSAKKFTQRLNHKKNVIIKNTQWLNLKSDQFSLVHFTQVNVLKVLSTLILLSHSLV